MRAPRLWGKATTIPRFRPLPLTSSRPRTETWWGLVEQWTDGTQVMLAMVILLAGATLCEGARGAVAPGTVAPGAVVPPAPLVAEDGEEAVARPGAQAPPSRHSANSDALRAFEFDCLRTAAPTTTTHS